MSEHETPPSDMTAEQAAKRAADAASVAITYAADGRDAAGDSYATVCRPNAFSGAADALARVAWWSAVASNLAYKAELALADEKLQGNLFRIRMAESKAALAEHYAQAAVDSFIEALDAIHNATT